MCHPNIDDPKTSNFTVQINDIICPAVVSPSRHPCKTWPVKATAQACGLQDGEGGGSEVKLGWLGTVGLFLIYSRHGKGNDPLLGRLTQVRVQLMYFILYIYQCRLVVVIGGKVNIGWGFSPAPIWCWGVCGDGVVDGLVEAAHLATDRLIGLRSWVKLHTC